MSGICGVVGKYEQHLLQRMSAAIRHRGPDREESFVQARVGLSARSLNLGTNGPKYLVLHNEKKDIYAIADAQLDGWQEMKLELEERGHRFYTDTELEIIPHLYEEFQEGAIERLRGAFALAVWDKKRKRLLLARDKLGIKPLYYFSGANFLFASEIKAILESPELKREVDVEALSSFLTFLYTPAPQTMFKGIKKLPPATLLIYTPSHIESHRYWQLHIRPSSYTSEEFYVDRLEQLLKASISSKLVKSSSPGVLLSGGLDSSGIVALLNELTPGSINTFSIGYTKRDSSFNELNYARLVAEHFGCRHYEYIVNPEDALRLMANLIQHMEEPFGNSSAIVTYLICRLAKEKVGFVFSGLGADELFAGSRKYIATKFMRLFQTIPFLLRKGLFFNLAEKLPESTKSRNLAGWIKGFLERGTIPQDKLSLSWFSFLNKQVRKDLSSDKLTALEQEYIDILPAEIQGAETKRTNSLQEIFYFDVKSWLGDNLLTLADKISMANSLDLELPFCNDLILDLSTAVPFGLKIKGLQSKYILVKTLGPLLPAPVLKRKRQGFIVPIGSWLKDELRDTAARILNKAEIESKGYFRYAYIEKMLQDHWRGRRNFADQLWALLTFELWHKTFIESDLYKNSSLTLQEIYS